MRPRRTSIEGLASTLLLVVPLVALMYFMVVRPQQKRQQAQDALLRSLEEGDDVITLGGLHGRVYALGEDTVDLEVTDDIVLRFQRSAVGRKVVHDDGETSSTS